MTYRSVGAGRKKEDAVSVEDALGYVQMVREALMDTQPGKYHHFLRVLGDFGDQRIGVAEVRSAAAALFRDNPELMLGLNVFLPEGHKIHDVDELACFVRDMRLHDGDGAGGE
ncbi:hypothetical protein ACP70R_024839 [Stipagrostis hirtigluma subsp. patula]